MRHQKLLDKMLEMHEEKIAAEGAAYAAQVRYQQAYDEYFGAIKEDDRRRAEFVEKVESYETTEEKILFILDNKEIIEEVGFTPLLHARYLHNKELKKEVEEND